MLELSSEKRLRLVEGFKPLLYYTYIDGARGCITAFKKNRLVTFCHGMHQRLKPGDVISIYSALDDNEFKATVVQCNSLRDYVILETEEAVCEKPPIMSAPYQGEEYVQFGFSATTQENSPLAITVGVFTSTEFSAVGHMLGSAGSNPGDSGGGCFSLSSRHLFGINVGSDNLPISGETTLNHLGSRFPSCAHIVPSSVFI